MLQKLEAFLIKSTIPALLEEKFFKTKLSSKDYLNLKKIIEMNWQLISGINENPNKLYSIRNYFLERLETVTITNATELLPTPLKSMASFPTLKLLTINFLRKRLMEKYKTIEEENRKPYLWDTLATLTEDLKIEVMDELENKNDKIIEPFGSFSAKEAYDFMMSIFQLLKLEISNEKFKTTQILTALKISLIGQTSVEPYLNNLEDLTGCTTELRDVLFWAIRRKRMNVYNKLLEIKSDFNLNEHAERLLPVAVEYANTEAYNSLLEISDKNKLLNDSFLLHFAAQSKSRKVVKKFLKDQFDPKKRDSMGWLPIHNAVKEGDLKLYNLLLPYVEKDLNDIDRFNLFYLAAVNGRLKILQTLMDNGLDLTLKNAKEKTLLECVNAKLNEHMKTEKKYWGAVYSSFDKYHKSIKFLLEHTPKQIANDTNEQPAITIEQSREIAEQNTRLMANIQDIVTHPNLTDNLSIYDRHCKGSRVKDSFFITFISLFTVAALFTLIVGLILKLSANSGKPDANLDNDHPGNVLTGIGGGALAGEILLTLGICLPKKKIPCTYFFRNNPGVANNNIPREEVEMEQVVPLLNP